MSAPEEAPAESAPEKPSDGGEEGVCEDSADAARGGPTGKKEASSSKTVADGKLVKGRPLPVPPSQTSGQVGGGGVRHLREVAVLKLPYLAVFPHLECGAIGIGARLRYSFVSWSVLASLTEMFSTCPGCLVPPWTLAATLAYGLWHQ